MTTSTATAGVQAPMTETVDGLGNLITIGDVVTVFVFVGRDDEYPSRVQRVITGIHEYQSGVLIEIGEESDGGRTTTAPASESYKFVR